MRSQNYTSKGQDISHSNLYISSSKTVFVSRAPRFRRYRSQVQLASPILVNHPALIGSQQCRYHCGEMYVCNLYGVQTYGKENQSPNPVIKDQRPKISRKCKSIYRKREARGLENFTGNRQPELTKKKYNPYNKIKPPTPTPWHHPLCLHFIAFSCVIGTSPMIEYVPDRGSRPQTSFRAKKRTTELVIRTV